MPCAKVCAAGAASVGVAVAVPEATLHRVVVLENSYHMVAVDNDRETVARSVLEFFGAAATAGVIVG